MNYDFFLNKKYKFKNKNLYRLEAKKKNKKPFLLFSVMTIVAVSIIVTFFIDTDRNALSYKQLAEPQTNTQLTAIELPEIGQLSPASSHTIIETEETDFKTLQKHSKINTKSNKLAPIQTTKASKLLDTTTDTSVLPVTLLSGTTKKVVVKKGDTLASIFKRLSLSSSTLHYIIHSGKKAKRLTQIKPGQELLITFNASNEFISLQYNFDKVNSLIVEKATEKHQYSSRIESKEIDIQQQFATGTINNSLFSAANKAGLNDTMIMKLAYLFGWDIDFALDIRKGDSFSILYEEKYIDGKKFADGNILSAEFVNRGKVFKAIRYTDAAGHTDYYSEKGLSMRKAFLRTPVDFTRISSRFSFRRKHPVLNRTRPHRGVDYAAPRGTPIKSVGDGKVTFRGVKGGYGRVVVVQHGSKYSTLYGHMNSFNKKVKRGTHVKQGQIIGYVGMSGIATGPHLHYEFRINGVHRNPLTVPLPSASPIAKKYLGDFQTTADTLLSQIKLRKQETIALSEQ